MDYKLMSKILREAVDNHLRLTGNEVDRSPMLCVAVLKAMREHERINPEDKYKVRQAHADITGDISKAIDGHAWARNYLIKVLKWPEDTPVGEIQAWRKQLAESLIEKYKEKAQ